MGSVLKLARYTLYNNTKYNVNSKEGMTTDISIQ